MSRRRPLATAIVVLLAAGGWGVFTGLRHVDPVSVDDAVARYRATATAPTSIPASAASAAPAAPLALAARAPIAEPLPVRAPSAASAPAAPVATTAAAANADMATTPARPADGVYVYDTVGYEELGVPGGHRDYPSQTTMTITASSCGSDVRWDVFDQRWDLWNTCSPDARVALLAFTTYHQFFGQVEQRHYTCGDGADLRPPAGEATVGTCADGDAAVQLTSKLIGPERLAVGGHDVDVVHVRLDEVLTGPTAGTRTSDSWYRSDDSLLVRRSAVTHVTSETTFGKKSYDEEVRVDLASVEPLR